MPLANLYFDFFPNVFSLVRLYSLALILKGEKYTKSLFYLKELASQKHQLTFAL